MRKQDDSNGQSKSVVEAAKPSELFDDMEHPARQQLKVVGRTVFCFRCEGSKEMASFYCACGSFLCTLHLAEHSCLVSASMQYNEELLAALT
jgi:hypothetical protein